MAELILVQRLAVHTVIDLMLRRVIILLNLASKVLARHCLPHDIQYHLGNQMKAQLQRDVILCFLRIHREIQKQKTQLTRLPEPSIVHIEACRIPVSVIRIEGQAKLSQDPVTQLTTHTVENIS